MAAAEAEAEVAAQPALEEVGQVLAPADPDLVSDMAAWVASATAVQYRPRPPGMRCNRRSQIRTRVANITARQASAQDTQCRSRFRILSLAAPIAERRASLRVNSPSRPEPLASAGASTQLPHGLRVHVEQRRHAGADLLEGALHRVGQLCRIRNRHGPAVAAFGHLFEGG